MPLARGLILLRDITADRELHPAPETNLLYQSKKKNGSVRTIGRLEVIDREILFLGE